MPTPIFGPVTATEPTRKITWGAPQPGDWLTYNGNDSANRYSPLKQIDAANVVLAEVEMGLPHSATSASRRRPLAADGVLYVTGPNQVFALDALTGEPLWHYSRPPSAGLVGDRRLGTNRGVAILRDKVFFVTDNAHLLALDRATGKLLWETPMAPVSNEHQPYGGTVAPLIVDDTGHRRRRRRRSRHPRLRRRLQARYRRSGLAALDRARAAASPASKPGRARNPSAAAAPPGSPAPTTRPPIRSTGPPAIPGPTATIATVPATISTPTASSRSTRRPGSSNGTTSSRRTIVKDRDATEPNVLVDTVYQGKPSKLLLHADRNGFFYVLDRTDGKVLLAKPFLRRVDWASSIGPDGRPVVIDPRGCPGDAANWDSTAFSPRHAPLLLHGAGGMRRQANRLPRSDRASDSCAPSISRRAKSRGRFRSPGPRAPRPGRAFSPPPAA